MNNLDEIIIKQDIDELEAAEPFLVLASDLNVTSGNIPTCSTINIKQHCYEENISDTNEYNDELDETDDWLPSDQNQFKDPLPYSNDTESEEDNVPLRSKFLHKKKLLRKRNNKNVKQDNLKEMSFVPRIQLFDTKFCSFQDRRHCSSCFEKINYAGHAKRFGDILCSRTKVETKDHENLTIQELEDLSYVDFMDNYKVGSRKNTDVQSVTVIEALQIIFELHLKSSVSKILLDEDDYVICRKCSCVLTRLYRCYIDFVECSREPSYLRNIFKNNKPLREHLSYLRSSNEENSALDLYNSEDYEDKIDRGIKSKIKRKKRKGNGIRSKLSSSKLQNAIPVAKYICNQDKCEAKFVRSNHLKAHLLTKHNIKEYLPSDEIFECPVCSKTVKSQKKLDSHLELHRPSIRQTKYQCDVCDKKYLDANNLRNHKLTHCLDRPFVCDTCGFATKRSYQLSRHVEMVHIGTRNHECTTCGVSFKKKQHLLDHEMTHKSMDYRPFLCTIEGCSKAYRSARNLRQHLEAHTGCKYQCETCGRVFTRKDNLKVHVDTVHLGKEGRAQREKARRAERGDPPSKRGRKPKVVKISENEEEPTLEIQFIQEKLKSNNAEFGEHNVQITSIASDMSPESHQLMLVDGVEGVNAETGTIHHIITTPSPQTSTTNVLTIQNTFGDYFYTS